MTHRSSRARNAEGTGGADRGHGTLPAEAFDLQSPSADERARARRVVAAFSRDGDDLRELLDMLDRWPATEDPVSAARRSAGPTRANTKEAAC